MHILSEWPSHSVVSLDDNDPEIKSESRELSNLDQVCHDVHSAPEHPIDSLIRHYSSMYRLKKALAWILRFKALLKDKQVSDGSLKCDELKFAERLLITHVQVNCYRNEMGRLKEGKP